MRAGRLGQSGGALLLFVACAGSPEPSGAARSPEAKLEIPPAMASEPPSPGGAEEAIPNDEVREADAPACRIVEKSWSFASLRLTEGGGVFASVSRAPTTLVLPRGAPRAPVAVFDDTQVLVRAVVEKGELLLFPRVPTALGGFLIPKSRTPLGWSGGAPGRLRVGVEAKSVLTWPDRVEDDVPCEAIALNVTGFDTRTMITERSQLPEKLVTRQDAELSLRAGDAAVARLKDGLRVQLVQAEAANARIVIEDPMFSVFGWVRSTDLGPAPRLVGKGRLGGSHRTLPPSIRDGRTCLGDLTLLAELGGVRVRIGVVRKATRFVVDAPQLDRAAETGAPPARGAHRVVRHVSIRLPMTRWLGLAEGARLLVPEDEYRECDPPPAPPGR